MNFGVIGSRLIQGCGAQHKVEGLVAKAEKLINADIVPLWDRCMRLRHKRYDSSSGQVQLNRLAD